MHERCNNNGRLNERIKYQSSGKSGTIYLNPFLVLADATPLMCGVRNGLVTNVQGVPGLKINTAASNFRGNSELEVSYKHGSDLQLLQS
jgi:hypothetical protein